MNKTSKLTFLPTKLEILTLLLCSAIILGILNYEQISGLLLGEGGPQSINQETLPIIRDFLLNIFSFVTANTATFLFWLIVGFIGIIILDLLHWLFQLYRRDLPLKGLANTFAPNKTDIMLHFVVRSIALMGLVGWILCLFLIVLPQCRTLFSKGLVWAPGMYNMAVGCILLGLYIYVVGILLRFLMLRKHLLE